MRIYGLQKLTLLDYPGKTACTLFTGGCNMRCPFCHNTPLIENFSASPFYTEEEIFSFLEKRRGLLDGVAVTGGEPLLQTGLASFMKKIKDMGFLVKLDTNGSLPDRLEELISARLPDCIAMDIKNCFGKYALTSGSEIDVSLIKESIRLIMSSGIDYEFRTTVVRELHTVEDIAAITESIRGAKKYFLQCFRDSGDILADGFSEPDRETLEKMARAARKNVLFCGVRGI